jgi:hypothetical protein|tara:strand:- start:427 stop:642 length:216 start_codon:yes stop_codon:yes gene_type:complete
LETNSQPKGMSNFLLKVLSLVLAIMVWFIIKTAAGLSYTNANKKPQPVSVKQPSPTLSNPNPVDNNESVNE